MGQKIGWKIVNCVEGEPKGVWATEECFLKIGILRDFGKIGIFLYNNISDGIILRMEIYIKM
jgi:hypothetical protein